MANILAIDTSSTWCSVALSLDNQLPQLRHEAVSAGASQLLLPWIESLLFEGNIALKDLDAIAVGIGPGAFTGVRLGVATVQGLAIAHELPVIGVTSLDAIAAQLANTLLFQTSTAKQFAIAIDARMEEIYWAHYSYESNQLPMRSGYIHLSKPEDLDLAGMEFLAGSAINVYGERLPKFTGSIDAEITVSALGIMECAQRSFINGGQSQVRELEPLYVRNKVALTTVERSKAIYDVR